MTRPSLSIASTSSSPGSTTLSLSVSDPFRPLRPGVAWLVTEQLLCRPQVIKDAVPRPAGRVHDRIVNVAGRLDGAGEKPASVRRTQVYVLGPVGLCNLLHLFARPRAP